MKIKFKTEPRTIFEKVAKKLSNLIINLCYAVLISIVIVIALFMIYGVVQAKNIAIPDGDSFKITTHRLKILQFGEDLNTKLTEFKIKRVKLDEPYKTERAMYAYQYSGFDKDFVLLLNAECGSWNCGLHELKYYRDGDLWSDYGLCGISTYYHTKRYIEAKEGWKKQVEICYDLYKKGVTFYGWDYRFQRGTNVIFNN